VTRSGHHFASKESKSSLESHMRIKLYGIFVDDQQKALDFYTNVLGFEKSQDIPVGEFRYITVASPEGGDAELSLEPNVNPAAKAYQEALFEQGIPISAFEVDDLTSEFRRLSDLGVAFTTEQTNAGDVTFAVFADTCGNLIQIYQPAPS
jgi:predicted enzyme related to lactoylglutathione lyase